MQDLDQPKIRVVIRKRPLNKKEIAKGEEDVVDIPTNHQVKVREHKTKVDLTKYIEEHSFNFDSAFGDQVNNQRLYEECIKPIISCAFMGARVTCFAYGQTGSGKTYTMNGDLQNGCPGIYYLGAEDIFMLKDSENSKLSISVSFFEIYCGKLFDLLNNRQPLQAREDGKQNVNIVGLTVKPVVTSQQFMETIAYGSSVRVTSQNSTNSDSSRSHAILQISLMNGKKVHGKISFIDLAGCQRGADTIDQNKQTKIDGAQINKSLLALKQCIRALDQGKNHTPFRGSKLTMVLKDSFTGFCRTVMIGNVSPGSGSCQNTLNTLRYADRVKQLKKGQGSNINQLSKEEQLARELMLPRNQRNKQIIIKNQSDSDQQIIINPNNLPRQKNTQKAGQSKPKQLNNKNNGSSTIPVKKIKYLHQKSIEEEQNGKKKLVGSNITAAQKGRKGIIGNHNENKSVNTAEEKGAQRMPRNKSISSHHKLDLQAFKKNPKKFHEDALDSNRAKYMQNHSAINLLGTHDINAHRYDEHPDIQIKPSRKTNPYIEMQKFSKSFKKIKTEQSEQLNYLQNRQYQQWQSILERFRNWTPSIYQFQIMSTHFQQLVKFIMKQEIQLGEYHKKILLKQETVLTESFNLYSEGHQQHKSNKEMKDYTSRLSQHFSGRINLFEEFTRKIQIYQYHLREHEQCEEKLIQAGELINRNNAGGGIMKENGDDVPLWME